MNGTPRPRHFCDPRSTSKLVKSAYLCGDSFQRMTICIFHSCQRELHRVAVRCSSQTRLGLERRSSMTTFPVGGAAAMLALDTGGQQVTVQKAAQRSGGICESVN